MSWLTTYGDMVTLLMTFFILLFALSTLNQKKFEKVQYAMQQTFGNGPSNSLMPGGTGILDGGTTLAPLPITREESQLYEVAEAMTVYIEDNGLEESVSVQADPRGLLIRFRDQVLFDLGRSELRDVSKPVLDKVGEVIAGLPNDVRIEGHTDNLPINTVRFPSNWDLSAARAVAVLQHFSAISGVVPDRLSIAGYGEYRPVASNATEEGRRLNRRVDVVILTIAITNSEPKSRGN